MESGNSTAFRFVGNLFIYCIYIDKELCDNILNVYLCIPTAFSHSGNTNQTKCAQQMWPICFSILTFKIRILICKCHTFP